jgi:hypothetical protein
MKFQSIFADLLFQFEIKPVLLHRLIQFQLFFEIANPNVPELNHSI